MKLTKKSEIKGFIGIHIPIGACNLKCEYCYVGQHENKLKDLPYSLEQIKKAFSKQRLGGIYFINICSDGETLIHPLMVEIIKFFLQDGHYVMVLTNGTLKTALQRCLELDESLLKRLFFKISFHYEEMIRLNMLDQEFENIEMIKNSPCSLTVEYITSDGTLENVNDLKDICNKRLGALPQINIPRDGKRHNLGVVSKYSWKNYLEKWNKEEFDSEFWKFRIQFYGKRYKDFCYTGLRQLWIDMKTGYSHQCYHTPPLQNFMEQCDKPIVWLAVGNNCKEAHCYVSHSHMSLGIVPYPSYTSYKTTYDVLRDRECVNQTTWIKPTMKKAFRMGVEEREYGNFGKKIVNQLNIFLRWYRRRYPIKK